MVPAGSQADAAAPWTLFDRLGLQYSTAVAEDENAAYGACVSDVGCGAVRFRAGKLTPKKAGLFVTVWRRAADGSTEPFDADDGIDLLVVMVRDENRFGQFVFPTHVLVAHGIVSTSGKHGKRGFRVYPPWSATENSQATRTQRWQCDHFLDLDDDVARARELFAGVIP